MKIPVLIFFSFACVTMTVSVEAVTPPVSWNPFLDLFNMAQQFFSSADPEKIYKGFSDTVSSFPISKPNPPIPTGTLVPSIPTSNKPFKFPPTNGAKSGYPFIPSDGFPENIGGQQFPYPANSAAFDTPDQNVDAPVITRPENPDFVPTPANSRLINPGVGSSDPIPPKSERQYFEAE